MVSEGRAFPRSAIFFKNKFGSYYGTYYLYYMKRNDDDLAYLVILLGMLCFIGFVIWIISHFNLI